MFNLKKKSMGMAFIFTVLLAAGCKDDAPCLGPFPDKVYKLGEKAVHLPTKEEVRIIDNWNLIGGNHCDRKKYGRYDIRFSDGAEVDVEWKDLKPIGS